MVLPDDLMDPKRRKMVFPKAASGTKGVLGTVCDVRDLTDVLHNLPSQVEVVLVQYKLAGCLACKSMYPKLKKMVSKLHEETRGRVAMLQVDCTDASWPSLFPFEVPAYPYFQIFDPTTGIQDGFNANLSSIEKVGDALDQALQVPRCMLSCPFPRPESMPVLASGDDDEDWWGDEEDSNKI